MIKVNNKVITPSYFPDGTLKLECELPPNIKIIDIVNFEWYYDNNEELIILDMLVKHIRANYFFKHFQAPFKY